MQNTFSPIRTASPSLSTALQFLTMHRKTGTSSPARSLVDSFTTCSGTVACFFTLARDVIPMTDGTDGRYARQVAMPGIGPAGQSRLLDAKVLVVGTGGLGSPALMYLAAAGVGTIRIVDNDVVDVSNLNRQVMHATTAVGMRKTASAVATLRAINPTITVEPVDTTFSRDTCESIARGMDYIIDASDNFDTKFLVNDTAVKLGIPCTIGGVIRWDGQLMSVLPGHGACYRCVFSSKPPDGTFQSPSELGIIGVTAGVIGTIAAAEAIKHVLGVPVEHRLVNRLLVMDLRAVDFTIVRIKPSPRCPACRPEGK